MRPMQKIKTGNGVQVTFLPVSKTFGQLDYWEVEFALAGREPVTIEVYELNGRTESGWYVPESEWFPDGFARLAVKAVEQAEQMADEEERLGDTQVMPLSDVQRHAENMIAAALAIGLLIGQFAVAGCVAVGPPQ